MESYIKFQNQFHEICRVQREKIAITYYRKDGAIEECDYVQMEKRVTGIVSRYMERGILRGDRVAVLIPQCTNTYLDSLALAYLGATAVVLDVNMHEKELERILVDADVSCIITNQLICDGKLKNNNLPIINLEDDAKWLRESDIVHTNDPDYEAMAILYSSGTTSQAKGVVIGYEQEFIAMDRLLDVVGTTEIKYFMLFPNSHISGYSDFLALTMRGGGLATMEDASITQILRGFQLYRPNTFGMIPKVWEAFKNKIEENIREKGKVTSAILFLLMDICGWVRKYTGINLGRIVFKSINKQVFGGELVQVHFGGGKSNVNVYRFYWNTGYDVYDFYASTEGNIPITVTQGNKYMESVGNINAYPGICIRIWNPNENGEGEIQIKSNALMKGYFRSPELTQQSFQDGFFKTGDYGKIVKNELYITGRIKECIHLTNGEKVSPEDIEATYKELLDKNIEFAVVGVEDGENYEKVCLFIEGEEGKYDDDFKRVNKEVISYYRFKKMMYVDSFPKTSVGKIKRYQLKKLYEDNMTCFERIDNDSDNSRNEMIIDKKEWLINKLGEYTDVSEISVEHMIIADLAIDSLNIFEICVDIEKAFGMKAENVFVSDISVGQLLDAISNNGQLNCKAEIYDYTKYPEERTKKDYMKFEKFCKWTKSKYNFSCSGIENIIEGKNYIFAPNHESYMDGMWIFSCMPKSVQDNLCTMAVDFLFENKKFATGTRMLGAVPVHREGNTSTAMKRIYKLILEENKSLLIHPEGTRSRDGKLGEFKIGVGELAIKTGTNIIPVAICGAGKIFPPHLKKPNIKKDKEGNKLSLHIAFGAPIDVTGFKDAVLLTAEVRENVKNMIEKYSK